MNGPKIILLFPGANISLCMEVLLKSQNSRPRSSVSPLFLFGLFSVLLEIPKKGGLQGRGTHNRQLAGSGHEVSTDMWHNRPPPRNKLFIHVEILPVSRH